MLVEHREQLDVLRREIPFLAGADAIIFPVHDLNTDKTAVARMREIVGDRYRVIPVPAHAIALGGGSVRCITQREPSAG